MKCENFDEYINLYLDGLISEKQTKELNEHIKICEKCREEFNVIENAKKIIDGEEKKELPENFHKELMKKIGEIKKTDKKIVKFPVFKAVAAAAAFAITVFACYNFTTEDFNKGVDVSGLETKNSVAETDKTEKSVPVIKESVIENESTSKKEPEKQKTTNTKENNTKADINYTTKEKTQETSETEEIQPARKTHPELSAPVAVVAEPEPAPQVQNESVQETEPVTEEASVAVAEPAVTSEVPAVAMDNSVDAQPVYEGQGAEEPQIAEAEPATVMPTEKRISSGGSAGGGGGGSSASFASADAFSETSQTKSASEILSSLGFGETVNGNAFRFDLSRYGEVMNALSASGATDYSVVTDDTTKTFTVTCN